MVDIISNKSDINLFLDKLKNRGLNDDSKYIDTVKSILKDIRINKDKALEEYTKKFDDKNFKIENIKLDNSLLKEAYLSIDEKLRDVLVKAKNRIYDYHMHQKRTTFTYQNESGEILGQKITPLERVGVYVPGGVASYPSSVLMNIVPALVAGVKEIALVTPLNNGKVNPVVLACAYICDVKEIYTIGGAQAIGALAYGTESIKKVDKIVGPGNIYVALAKKEVYGHVGIDSIAGPSEILIIADETANPKFIAYDFLAQAEHDVLASSVVLTTSKEIGLKVKEEIEKIIETAKRKEILEKSVPDYSKIILLENIDDCFTLANYIAPEHLELCIKNPSDSLDKVLNAGAIFLGNYSPEALGDYMAGPNHILPTVSTSRFFSPLGFDDFIKKSSIIYFNEESIKDLIDDVALFADSEGLEMHKESVLVRRNK